MTKLENMKNGQVPKNKKKLWNLVVPKPANHNLRRKTKTTTKFEIGRKKEHSLIADTKLKKEAKFKKPFFI